MLDGVDRIVDRHAALWTRLSGHAQSQRIVGDGRAPGQYPGSTTAPPCRICTHHPRFPNEQAGELIGPFCALAGIAAGIQDRVGELWDGYGRSSAAVSPVSFRSAIQRLIWVLELRPSLLRMLVMWVSTVRSDKNSLSAICLSVRPSSTCRARPVACASAGHRAGLGCWCRLWRLFVFDGEGGPFLGRHCPAALEGRLVCGLAQPEGCGGH